MDPISSSDRLVALLRQKLQERSKSASARPGRKGGPGDAAPKALDSVHALAGVEGVDDRQLRRALIQSILADQLGAELINEAEFQQVVERVVDTLDGDEASSRLLARLVRELRPSR